tara:strand:- start:23 stop:910 length:888 start_codon:yes stop_codon:yes gene_type:complete
MRRIVSSKLLLLTDKMIHNESEIESRHGRLKRLYLTKVDSTNDYAMKILRENPHFPSSPNGFLVTTSEQKKGKGQRGNIWSSAPKLDLAMTWVVQKPPKVAAIVFNMAAALATAKGVRKAVKKSIGIDFPSVALAVKWPNDVMIWANGSYRKIAGILVENHWRGENWTASTVGIGVNVNSRRIALGYNAVSISEVLSEDIDPQRLELPILDHLLDYIELLKDEGGAESIIEEFNSKLFGRGELREYIVGDNKHMGTLTKIDEEGIGVFEWKKSDNTPPARIYSSEVKWVFSLHTL